MKFVHRSSIPGETIAAIATPPGEGGVAIIRISGNNSIEVASKIFSKEVRELKSHTVNYGKIFSSDNKKIDDVLLVVMKGPRSFTGEDIVEIHCHGGRIITRKILERVLEEGARLANPGEFSLRSFINGKIDLAQAEAIQQVISAKSERALFFAESQLDGILSKKIRSFQIRLTELAAILEAWVDFPEEDLEFISHEELISTLSLIICDVEKLIKTFHYGKIIHEGPSLCLAGSPNVGKSSLMNALLRKDRSIVSNIAGTTRDLIEDNLHLEGIHFRITDTAGIRETKELIENEGVKRSKKAIETADIVLFILDVQSSINGEERELINILPNDKTIAVWNKVDLEFRRPLPELPFKYIVEASTKNEYGLDSLQKTISLFIDGQHEQSQDEIVITNARHLEALTSSLKALKCAMQSVMENASPEFSAFDVRDALSHLGTIIGSDITDDILTQVFSKFCIGK